MTLQLIKSELLSVLSDAYDETSWSDGALEEAIRQGLLFFHPYALMREASFTLLESGYEHDLSSLNAHEIVYIGWPWGDGYKLDQVARSWRLISDGNIRMDDLSLDSGEVLRVQYRPRHTIKYLDGSSDATTFLPIEQQRFLLAAAHYALMGRARLLAHIGSDVHGDASGLMLAADSYMRQFMDFSVQQPGVSAYVTWGSLGL